MGLNFLVIFAAGGSDRFMPILSLALLVTVGVALLLWKLRFPALPGYFLCGFLLARTGLMDLSHGSESSHLLQNMSDVGIILLMFSIGIECSVNELKMLKKRGLAAGLLQVGLTTMAGAGIALLCGIAFGPALLWGLLVMLSSTAVGVRLFEDNGIPGHPAARQVLGISLIQDMVVILALILLPGLSEGGGWQMIGRATGILALEGLVFLAIAAILSRYGIPRFLAAVSRTKSRELFTLAVLTLCAGIGSVGQLLGLGVPLGAFAAGVAVSGSVYNHRILADAAPFKDFFLTVFFLSIGALIDVSVFVDHWIIVTGLSLGVLIFKIALTTLACRLARVPMAHALLAGTALAGVGEFSVVLSRNAGEAGLLTREHSQMVLAVTALTLSISPILMRLLLPRLKRLTPASIPHPKTKPRAAVVIQKIKDLQDHAILCGYGTVGQILHKGLLRLGIPVVIIELNSDTVASLLKHGHAVLFADISQADTLELAGIARARMIVITFPHAEIARTAITMARERNPGIHTLCRARFPDEAVSLRKVDPDCVVHDEFESGIKMLRLCMRHFNRDDEDLLPRHWINQDV